MLKLLKYEFRKTRMPKLVLLALTVVLEAAYLLALKQKKEELLVPTVALLTILAICGILLIGIQSVVTLHRDMNTRQSYMLFMTPNSSYKILGAKVIECTLSVFAAGCVYFALGILDVRLLFNTFESAESLSDMLIRTFNTLGSGLGITIKPDVLSIGSWLFNQLANWLATVCTAFLADVIAASLLNGKKGSALLSFVLFIAIVLLMTLIPVIPISSDVLMLFVNGLVFAVISAGMYVVSAMLMERYLSV